MCERLFIVIVTLMQRDVSWRQTRRTLERVRKRQIVNEVFLTPVRVFMPRHTTPCHKFPSSDKEPFEAKL